MASSAARARRPPRKQPRVHDSPSSDDSDAAGSASGSSSSSSSLEDAELEAAAAAGEGGKRVRLPRRSARLLRAARHHPAAGLQEDLEAFFRGFVDAGVARFAAFAERFRSGRLAALCYGRDSPEHLAEFVQCLYHLLALYTQPPHPTLLRIGAVYLLYAYYCKLEDLLNVQIRVSLSQWLRLSELRHQLTQEGHCDALYCLRYLTLCGAFLLCAQPLPCYPDAPPALCSAAQAARCRLAGEQEPLRELLGEERLDTLRALHAQYVALKAPLADAAPALRVVDEGAVERVERACEEAAPELRRKD